jgi:hypothetical protein
MGHLLLVGIHARLVGVEVLKIIINSVTHNSDTIDLISLYQWFFSASAARL